MVPQTAPYGFGTRVPLPFERAVHRTREELPKRGSAY